MDVEEILKYADYPKAYAASLMGLSVHELSLLCKKHGIQRWPYHAQRKYKSKVKSPFIMFDVEQTIPFNQTATKAEKQKRESPKTKRKNFEGVVVNKIQLKQKYSTDNLNSNDTEIDVQSEITKIDVKTPLKKKKKNSIVFDEIPVDWTIKTKVKFTSKHSFSWTNHINSLSESVGLTSFVQDIDVPSDLSESGYSTQTVNESISPKLYSEFMKSMLYYQHPSELLSEKLLKYYQKEEEIFLNRIKLWHEAFRSIYNCLKNCEIPYFYYINDQISVLFLTPGICSLQRITAILSNPSSLLKDEFKLSNIQYEQTLKGSLIFSGKVRVQSLFNFLLNKCIKDELSYDVPQILSPGAFLYGTVHSLTISKLGTITKKNEKEVNHYIEFEGSMMIHNLINLSNLFCETQRDNFVVSFTSTETKTKNLNVEINKSLSQSQSFMTRNWNKDSKLFEFLENEFHPTNEVSTIIRSEGEYIIEYKK
eukprot:gene3876-7090_t